jgi:Ca2+-transporting ATPase
MSTGSHHVGKKLSYSRLLPSSTTSPSPSSSRSSSPAPLPPDDHFAYSTQLRRHEPESIVEFGAHGLQDLKDQVQARFTAYDPLPSNDTSSHSNQYPPPTTSSTTSHHPFAHTASPLTPSAHFATLSIPQTLSQLSTSASTGLETSKVPAIRELSGANEFEVEAKESTLKKFLAKFWEDPLILLLLASAGVSVVVGNYDDAASIIVAVLIVVTGELSFILFSRLPISVKFLKHRFADSFIFRFSWFRTRTEIGEITRSIE